MKKIVVSQLIEQVRDKWEPEDVCFINDTAMRVAKLEGAYQWHTHPGEDELFMVVKGRVCIDSEDGNVELNENECVVVPRGVRHRSRTDEPAWVLLVEPTKTKTKGF